MTKYCETCCATRKDGNFCPICGKKLVVRVEQFVCPNCIGERHGKFCGVCGAKLVPKKTPSSANLKETRKRSTYKSRYDYSSIRPQISNSPISTNKPQVQTITSMKKSPNQNRNTISLTPNQIRNTNKPQNQSRNTIQMNKPQQQQQQQTTGRALPTPKPTPSTPPPSFSSSPPSSSLSSSPTSPTSISRTTTITKRTTTQRGGETISQPTSPPPKVPSRKSLSPGPPPPRPLRHDLVTTSPNRNLEKSQSVSAIRRVRRIDSKPAPRQDSEDGNLDQHTKETKGWSIAKLGSTLTSIGSSITDTISDSIDSISSLTSSSTRRESENFLSSPAADVFWAQREEDSSQQGEQGERANSLKAEKEDHVTQERVRRMVSIFEGMENQQQQQQQQQQTQQQQKGDLASRGGVTKKEEEGLAMNDFVEVGRGDSEKTEYDLLLELSKNEDFTDLDDKNFFYLSGKDTFGNQILVLIGRQIPANQVDMARLILYFISKMDSVVDQPYVLVFCNSGMSSENRPNYAFLKKVHEFFGRKYRKNVQGVYIVHPTTSTKMFFRAFRPVISTKFWKKLFYIEEPTDLYREERFKNRSVLLPEFVILYHRPQKKVFGAPLEEVLIETSQGWCLPAVLEQSIFYLCLEDLSEKIGLETEGIFRVSGSKDGIVALREKFDECSPTQPIDLSEVCVHTVASCLKQYLRELPEPLLSFGLYDDFVAAEANYDQLGPDKWATKITELILKLPEPNRRALNILFLLLHKLVQKSEKNKMTAKNLSIVFGPNLLYSATLGAEESFSHVGLCNMCVCRMIENAKSLWLDRDMLK